MLEYLAYDIAGVLVGLIVAALLALLVVAVRRRLLQRRGGTVDCSVRTGGDAPWRVGVARYNGEVLQWYRLFSVAPRPHLVVSRRGLVVTDRRRPRRDEAAALPRDAMVIACHDRGATMELAMSEPALTGFLAWLEATPPGTHVNPYP